MSATIDQITDINKVLVAWYVSCDKNMTGQVKSNDLVEKIKEYVKSNHEERKAKILMNDLTERLDNRKDNCYVDQDTFIKAASAWWIQMMVQQMSVWIMNDFNASNFRTKKMGRSFPTKDHYPLNSQMAPMT